MIRYDLPTKAPCAAEGCPTTISPRFVGGPLCQWHQSKKANPKDLREDVWRRALTSRQADT